MKTKLAILLAGSALAGFVIAANRPGSKPDPATTDSPQLPAIAEEITPQLAPAPAANVEADEASLEPKLAAAPPAAEKESGAPPAQSKGSGKGNATAKTAAAGGSDNAADAPPQVFSTDLGGKDLLFLTAALEHGQVQQYLGELAKTRAGTEQVKAVGEVLASTQTEENKKLARLAAMKGVTLGGNEAAGKKALAQKLEKLTGPKFDKACMEEIINVNQRAVATYEAAATTKDGEIKAFVTQGLPLAKEKLALANKMSGNAPRKDQNPGFRAEPTAPATPPALDAPAKTPAQR